MTVDTTKEKEAATTLGLSLVHFRLLTSLKKAGDKGRTYREFEKDTGYYSILTAQLRAESNRGAAHEGSLEALGLVKVIQHEDEPLRFVLTAKGRKKIGVEKTNKAK